MKTTIANLEMTALLKLAAGRTIGEQLQGKTLANADTVEFIRSFDGHGLNFTAPSHWEKPSAKEYSQGITIVTCVCLNSKGKAAHFNHDEFLGFLWFTKGMPSDSSHLIEKGGVRIPDGNVMDLMVFDSAEEAQKKGGWWNRHRILVEL